MNLNQDFVMKHAIYPAFGKLGVKLELEMLLEGSGKQDSPGEQDRSCPTPLPSILSSVDKWRRLREKSLINYNLQFKSI